jgi:DNA-binding NtrC family response regulator
MISPHVLLVGAEWHPRTMLRAQLIEDGMDVEAVGSWDEAELLLMRRALKPQLVLYDLAGEPNPEASLRTLARLVPTDRTIVLTAAGVLSPEAVGALGFSRVFARPFSVQDVVTAVRRVLGVRS